MKLLKTVPAAALLAGGLFASACAMADDSVFTVMDDPSSAKNLSKVLLTPVIWRSPAIRKVPQ
jgi:putative salt-induced outer membrane protein YdiY